MTDRAWERLHGYATLSWGVLVPVVVLTGLGVSLRFLAAVTVASALLGQAGAWHTARAERRQRERDVESRRRTP